MRAFVGNRTFVQIETIVPQLGGV